MYIWEIKNMAIYENNLGIDKLARMFENTAQSYKMYWFEAILTLAAEEDRDLTFEEIIDEMICEAWYTVTHYHLRLGPTVNGNVENYLEHAIRILNQNARKLPQNPSREVLKDAIKKCENELKEDKFHLTDYVPYKILSPFFDNDDMEEGLSYIRNDKRSQLIKYMEKFTEEDTLLYVILAGKGMQKKIRLNRYWREYLLQNYAIVKSWIQRYKVEFLQDRNPGVPGIIYKINSENEDQRKLEQVRNLWKMISDISGAPLRDIYTGKDIPDGNLSIDHFVPRSYISNDEIWNLIPMNRSLNSSKNNRLPDWNQYFGKFADYQFYLYNLVFGDVPEEKRRKLKAQFDKCRKDNLNAIWAAETLYIPGNSREQFINILEHNLKPIYETAKLQGYELWRNRI